MKYILVPKKHPGKRFSQICSFKKPSSSVVSGKPNSNYIYTFTWFIITRARRAKFVPGGEGSGDVQLHATSFWEGRKVVNLGFLIFDFIHMFLKMYIITYPLRPMSKKFFYESLPRPVWR